MPTHEELSRLEHYGPPCSKCGVEGGAHHIDCPRYVPPCVVCGEPSRDDLGCDGHYCSTTCASEDDPPFDAMGKPLHWEREP